MKKLAVITLALLAAVSPTFAEDVILKTNSSRVEVYRPNGGFIRSISASNLLDARSNGNVIVILKGDGRVEVYNMNGAFIRSISASGASRIDVTANEIAVTRNGRVEVYNMNGAFIRSI